MTGRTGQWPWGDRKGFWLTTLDWFKGNRKPDTAFFGKKHGFLSYRFSRKKQAIDNSSSATAKFVRWTTDLMIEWLSWPLTDCVCGWRTDWVSLLFSELLLLCATSSPNQSILLRASSSLSYTFSEQLFPWTISSLSHLLFSELLRGTFSLPLFWATSIHAAVMQWRQASSTQIDQPFFIHISS